MNTVILPAGDKYVLVVVEPFHSSAEASEAQKAVKELLVPTPEVPVVVEVGDNGSPSGHSH